MDFDLSTAIDLASRGIDVKNGKLLLTRSGYSYKLCDRELDFSLLANLEDNFFKWLEDL